MSKKRGSISAERDKRQAKVFTKWINSHLKKRGREVSSLTKDFDDGVNLCILYEQISGDKLKKVAMKPKGRIQAMSNLSNVLTKVNKFVKECGIGLQYSPQQVADGDEKQILGMIWILITKFVIPESEEDISAKKSLLRWCQRVTEPYENVDIKNFHKSWKDGLAFNALLHQFDQGLLNYGELKKENEKENLEKAFAKAEDLGISRLLDPEDITEFEVPDEKSIICYVSTMYQFFHSQLEEMLKKDMESFTVDVTKLLKWISESIDKYKNKEFPDNIDECKKLEEGLHDFNLEKGKYAKYKSNLYLRLASIQRRQRNERLKVFVPTDDVALSKVHESWLQLNNTQVEYSGALRDHVIKLEEEERKRIEGEIKAYEAELKAKREEEVGLIDATRKERFEKNQMQRELARVRKEEEVLRKELQARKKREYEFRVAEAERKRLEEEARKKREKEQEEKEKERLRKEKEIQEKELEEKKRREEERKRIEKEIQEREVIEREDRKAETERAILSVKNSVDEEEVRLLLIGARIGESILRKEQEKQKRDDLERRNRAKERKEKDLELTKAEEEEQKKRDGERKAKENEIQEKEDAERDKRQKERERIMKEKKDKEDDERTKLGEYDKLASDYIKWINETQSPLTSVVEVAEDEEDESTDEETRNKRVEAVKAAKEKVTIIEEKWAVLVTDKIEEWASIPLSEVLSAKDTMCFALVGEESSALSEIRQFKIEEKK